MLVHRTICTECRVILGSESGFTVGQPITCPECRDEFVVRTGKNNSYRQPVKPMRAAAIAEIDETDSESPAKTKSKPSVVIDDEDEDDTLPPPKAKSKPSVGIEDDEEEVVTPKKRARVESDEDDDDRPIRKKKKSSSSGKKKGKRRGDDDEKKSYKNSPIRFVILGVLLLILAVMAYFLYIKKTDEGKSGLVPVRTTLTYAC